MKTNFKKLASSAAVAAGLAAGSMSAHAVVQAVPANAQLIPFWYHNSSGVGPTREVRTDTIARITVPKSVGLDQVIGYLNPTTSPTGAFESDGDKDLSPVIINDTVLLPGGNNNQPLSNTAPFFQGDAIDANLYPNSFIHWWFLDVKSQHVVNGRFPVSQDDVVVISASNLGITGAVPTGNIFNGVSAIPNNVPGYLILANESARNGGAPLFGLTADAWVANLGGLEVDRRFARYNGFPSAVNIPTFGLADGVDSTSYPTPTNQVIQNQAFISGNFWPVASPLTSGIRTGVTGPSVTGRNLKVVEIPLADRAQFDNFVFVWNDRNNKDGIVQADEIDQDENACSTNLSLPQQLNVAWVPANNYGHLGISNGNATVSDAPDGYFPPTPPAFIVDSYAQVGAKAGSAFYPSNIYNGQTPLCQTNSRDGFVKAYLNPPAAPAGAPAGAYSALVAFTIPQLTFPIDPSHGGLLPGQLSSTRTTELAQDRGFFSGR
jgi:hypothetical protein